MGILIRDGGSSQADRHPLTDEQVELLKTSLRMTPVTKAFLVLMQNTGASLA